MAAPSSTPNSLATISVPRVRFIFAAAFVGSATIFAISRIISGTELPALYRTAMFCAIFTELLTLKLFIPVFSMKPEVLNAISSSPVLPHLMLSIFLWINSSTFLVLIGLVQTISIIIVYFYLVIEYIPTDANVSQNPYWRVYGKPFADSMIPRKAKLLIISAHLEIFNLVLVLVSIIRMTGNLIHLLVFTQYLVSQYISSPIMSHALIFWNGMIVKVLNDPRCPHYIKIANQKVREYLQKLVLFTSQYVKPQVQVKTKENVKK